MKSRGRRQRRLRSGRCVSPRAGARRPRVRARRRAGGHANTVVHDGLALDTGFLVHNERNYPLLGRLFRELGVAHTRVGHVLLGQLLRLRARVLRPAPVRAARERSPGPGSSALMWEIGRWLRTRAGHGDETQSLAEYLDEHGFSRRFRRHFLVPLTSALWSTAPGRALEFPAAYAIRFFDNHGMLGFGRFRWRTVTGGSRRTSTRSRRRLGDAPPARERRPLASAARPTASSCAIGDRVERFDHVVLATHADQALATARGSDSPTSGACSAASATRRTRRSCTPTPRYLPRTRAGPRLLELPPRRRRPPDDHVPPQPAAGARRRARLLRDAERARAGGARPRSGSPTSTRSTRSRRCARRPSCRGSPAGARTTRARYFGNGFHEDGLASGVAAARALGVEW